MLTLNDGRSELWQWDTGRTLAVDAYCSQVHFSNKVFGRSIDVDVVDDVAIIPDVLLQTDKELTAWAFVGTAENGYTKISKIFKVNKRNKPADYVFTPVEQTTLAEIVERLENIESTQDPDAIKNAVEDYLADNPIRIDETDPTVPEWAKQPQKPTYTAEEVGALPSDTPIPDAYILPIATAETLGGVKPVAVTDDMTQPVGVDAVGALFTVPGASGGGYVLLNDITLEEPVNSFERSTSDLGVPYNLSRVLIRVSFSEIESEYGSLYYTNNLFSGETKLNNVIHRRRIGALETFEHYGKIDHRQWWEDAYGAQMDRNETEKGNRSADETVFSNFAPVTNIKLRFDNQSVKGNIKIWGVAM